MVLSPSGFPGVPEAPRTRKEPWIVAPDGIRFNLSTDIWDCVFEEQKVGCLQGAAGYRIRFPSEGPRDAGQL